MDLTLSYKEIILIGGVPRSGTTLLQKMISQNKSVNPLLPECSYFADLLTLKRKWMTYSGEKTNAFFGTQEQIDEFIINTVNNLLSIISKKHNSSVLCLKDPLFANYIKEIEEIFENRIKFILTVRDPRDVISSYFQVIKRKNELGLMEYNNINNFDDIINEIYLYYFNIMNNQTYLVVRYEDIINHQYQIVENYIGFKLENIFIRDSVMDFDKEMEKNPYLKSEYKEKSIIQNNDGKYKKYLEISQIEKINAVFSGVIEKYNYKVM